MSGVWTLLSWVSLRVSQGHNHSVGLLHLPWSPSFPPKLLQIAGRIQFLTACRAPQLLDVAALHNMASQLVYSGPLGEHLFWGRRPRPPFKDFYSIKSDPLKIISLWIIAQITDWRSRLHLHNVFIFAIRCTLIIRVITHPTYRSWALSREGDHIEHVHLGSGIWGPFWNSTCRVETLPGTCGCAGLQVKPGPHDLSRARAECV